MNPHQLIGLVGPANNFAMGGMPMHFARNTVEGRTLPSQTPVLGHYG